MRVIIYAHIKKGEEQRALPLRFPPQETPHAELIPLVLQNPHRIGLCRGLVPAYQGILYFVVQISPP